MKKCKTCDNLIQDQYEYCIKCMTQVKQGNTNQELTKVLTQINWNLGTIAKQQRLFYLFEIILKSELGNNPESVETGIKILNFFSQDLEKDLKQLKQIKEEQDKTNVTPN